MLTVVCASPGNRNRSRFAVQTQERCVLLPKGRSRVRLEGAISARRLHGFGNGRCGLRVDELGPRRRDRRSRRLGLGRLHLWRLDHARRDRCSGSRGCIDGGRRAFGCHRRRRLSRRCRRGRGGRLGHRRGSLRLRRFNCRRRSDLCDRRRPRRRRAAGRQQGQGIDVALRIARHAQAEVHVRLRQFDDTARADRPHHRRFSHERAARHPDGAEVDERGRVPERRLDRHRLPAGRHRPGKGHHTLRGGEHRAAAGRAKVDAAVLAACVRMRVVEQERPQHRAVDRPRPGARIGDGERTRADGQDRKSPHYSSSLPILRTRRP